MKIGTRLTIALLVAAILPLLVVGLWSLYSLGQATDLALTEGKAVLADLGQEAIRHRAESVARQVELYLAAHPGLDPGDAAQLEADARLAKIAVQPVGETGYTVVFDWGGVTHFHNDPDLIGRNMDFLAEALPEFWAIFEASLDGSESDGYYDWEDPDGQIRAKYMYIVPVGSSPLRVAATTYIDEFSRPANQIQTQLQAIQIRAAVQLVVVLVIVALLALGGAYLFSRNIGQSIDQLVDTSGEIASGDLTVEPPEQAGELGLLADAFARMTGSLSSLIRRVRTMSLHLSSAAEQIMMTQRQHAANADQQAVAVNSASVAAQELASSSAHIAGTSQQVVSAANQTQESAQQGVQAMAEAAQHLQRIALGNEAAVIKVRELGTLARQISLVMDLIEDVADQTKLIAFNASIEASAAGEAGRRFAVVAAEVRHLAGDVARSTDEIRSNVEQIQTTTNELLIASERESKEIEGGLEIGDRVRDLLDQILTDAQQTTLAVRQISGSTQEQQQATEQLLGDLQPLTDSAGTIALGSKETVAVMEDLVDSVRELERTVARFKLPG